MIDRHLLLRAASALAIAIGITSGAQADDCLRRMGFGFSAGYHAPVACPTPGCHQKLGVWTGWKQACALPNVRPLGGACDAAPCAPCSMPAAPCCGGQGPAFYAPGLGSGFGLRTLPAIPGGAMPGGCSTCNGRAPLMFN